jgi:Sec-independent protein translocase protein TatA
LFGIGGVELAIILVFAFLLFGPDKLPQIIRTVTQVLNQLKGLRDQANQVIKAEVVDPLKDIEKQVAPLTNNATTASDKLAQKLGLATDTISETLKPVGETLKTAGQATTAAVAATAKTDTSPALKMATPEDLSLDMTPASNSTTSKSNASITPDSTTPKESFTERKAHLEQLHAAAQKSRQAKLDVPEHQSDTSTPDHDRERE